MTTNDQAAMNEQLTQLRLQGLSIDGDNRYKQDLIDAVIGAMMFGAQGANPPPSGHWLEQFYVIAREEREALARVEAERDTAIAQMQNIRKERDRINKELGDTEFNLCIAQQQLADVLYILDQHRTWTGMGWEQLPVPAHAVEKIRSKLAQAEQQEARPCPDCKGTGKPLDPVEHGDDYGYCDSCGATGRAGQEAQGAQAGDEARKAAFENHWYAQKATAFGSAEAQRHFDAGWHARAALATQPAEYPAGAVENGRTLMSRLEQWYTFADDQGHALAMCKEWLDLKECFEHMADALSAARGADHA